MSNVRFYLEGKCIIRFIRTKAIPNCCSPCVPLVPTQCSQSDSERCIFGKWVVNEVRKAVERGYNIMDVFEFWE